MEVALTPDDPGFVDVHQLRVEHGWFDVAKGLRKTLAGHLLVVGGAMLSCGLIAALIVSLMHEKKTGKSANLAFEAGVWLGIGLLCISVLWGYGKILLGMWMCLKHAPERCGAKWVMFVSITCLITGPAFNVASSFGGINKQPEFRRGPNEFKLPEFSPSVRNLQIACNVVGMLGYVMFVLFLRAVARCFGDAQRASTVMAFLIFQGVLFAASLYVILLEPMLLIDEPMVPIGIGLGWICSGLWFLYLLASIRRCIIDGMEYTHSPLSL
jgi:hypothetical protein